MSSIRSRLVLYTTVIILVVAASITFFSTLSSRKQSLNTQRDHALEITRMVSSLVAPALYDLDSVTVRNKLAEIKISVPSIHKIYILDSERRIFSDGSKTNPLRGQVLPHEGATKFFSQLEIDTAISAQHVVVGGPIMLTENEVLGYIYAAFSSKETRDRLRDTIRGNIFLFVLCGVLGIGSAVLFARRFSAPLERLTSSANRIARGDRDVLIRTDGNDEIARLAQALEIMLRRLQEQTVELRTLNPSLDQKVRERTERLRQQAAELRLARDAAEDASRIKSNFLATMSHELRTPLNGLLGMIDLIADTPLNTKQLDYLQTAKLSGKNLLNLINNILDFSKLEAEKVDLEKIEFSLTDILNEMAQIYLPAAKQKGLLLGIDIDGQLPQRIYGDPARLKQILSNLIDNALKFTAEGFVTIQAMPETNATGQSMIRFIVSDTGCGIITDDQDHLFELFTQEDSSTTRKHGGTGLGLAICKQLTELMGGEINVDSDPDMGSRFWFTIPLLVDQDIISHTAKTDPAPTRSEEAMTADINGDSADPRHRDSEDNLSQAHILIVEDNKINRELLLAMLNTSHRRIETVENGAQAVKAVQDHDFDLVLMDISMPVMDGIEATKEIRKLSSPKSSIPIIAVTANAMPGDKERFLDAGMDDYLAKPIDVMALFDLLRKYIP